MADNNLTDISALGMPRNTTTSDINSLPHDSLVQINAPPFPSRSTKLLIAHKD